MEASEPVAKKPRKAAEDGTGNQSSGARMTIMRSLTLFTSRIFQRDYGTHSVFNCSSSSVRGNNQQTRNNDDDDDDDAKPDAATSSSSSVHGNNQQTRKHNYDGDDAKPDAATSSSSSSVRGNNQLTRNNDADAKPDSATSSLSSLHGNKQPAQDKERSIGGNVRFKEEPGVEDAQPAARENKKLQRVLVEFKFRSYKTQLFKEGGLKGTLHVAMDQDQDSGMCSIPVGETPFQADLDEIKTESWCMGGEGFHEFSGTFTRTSLNGPVDMDPGLTLDYFTGNHRDFKVTVRPSSVAKTFPKYRALKAYGSERFVAHGLSNWEKGQGGFLELRADVSTSWENDVRWGWYGGTFAESRAAKGTHKIKLYTVLSAHRPNQEDDSLPNYSVGQCPDWDALVSIVAARFPDKGDCWASRAVRQYRYFMDLKVDPKLAKQKFSPSCAIDKIWHAHLSFPERYQHDMACLTKGDGIVEHLPVHLKLSTKYYEKAHTQHSKRMAKLQLPVDEEFWPEPTPYDPSQHENTSDDEKMKGVLVCGKPAYTGPESAGCGGCG